MKGLLIGDRIVVKDKKADKLFQRGYGKKINDGLELSLVEGLFLIEKGALELENASFRDIVKKIEKEDEFMIKYRVYKDLRERGYTVKTGLKFGAHFRVYERGKFGKDHSKFLVHAFSEGEKISFPEIARAVRLAHSVKKIMIFAVVDSEGEITYYKVERILP